ncbi:LPS export ABC transporter periplasmic protein LptC [Pyxidicoccus xibeiensis]|uniref:LPS export ABC transporter periplasmic protein LptC n=1 Tax=Pyxidicoccus xibeiensis TaxID=2906759 RepID=UPI0020A71D98|nr:LPS export ABC transporter periplasmic protein LptC [Pyxidicoccus xibeiensis]MCP3144205.1 LPS export ABC transporter periplasmic protein LptC [Pyxidicoccus xibeiensis]
MSRLPAASLAAMLLAACTPRRAAEGQQEQEPPPQVVLYGARLESYEGERLTLSGTAERLTYQRAGGDVQGTNATLKVPPGQDARGGSGGVEVSAPNMEGSLASKQLVGSGGVVIRTGEGMVARTPRLTYDANTGQANGNEGVTVTGADYRMRADRFELSLPDETYTFDGSVETVLGAAE